MPDTFIKIASATVTGSPADISFTSIPQTYTDLVLIVSAIARTTANPNSLVMFVNGYGPATASYRYIRGNGSTATSGNASGYAVGDITNISNTYSSATIYIPNYRTSNFKSVSSDSVTENNGTTAYASMWAGLLSTTDAITSIQFGDGSAGGGLGVGTQITLYGIKNS